MFLESKVSGKLQNCLNTIKDATANVWKKPKLTHYTNHDLAHSENIISILNKILETAPDDLLNENECFVLLASAYLHDIGMQSAMHVGLADKTDYTLDEKELIRSKHNESSKKMIIESLGSGISLGLEQCKEYIPFLSTVVESHSSKVKIDEVHDTSFQGETIKLKLLSALLKLSDELDRDYRRVDMDELELWNIPVESKFHWWAHHYTQSIHIENGKIKIYLRFPSEYKDSEFISLFVKSVGSSIKNQLHEVYEILWENAIKLFLDEEVSIEYLEGIMNLMPSDLITYLKNDIVKSSEKSQNADIRTGIHWYVDGIAYSENKEIMECFFGILKDLSEEEYLKAIEKVNDGLLLSLAPLERAGLLLIGGNCHYMVADMSNSEKYYRMALKICEKENIQLIYKEEAIKVCAVSLNNIGIIHRWKGDLDEALEDHNGSLNIYNGLDDQIGVAKTLNDIGLVYADKADYDKALEFHEKSLEIYAQKKCKQGKAMNLINIGIVYADKGDNYKALECFKEALEINKQISYKNGKAIALSNLGLAYKNLGDLGNALNFYGKALKMFNEVGNRSEESVQLCNVAAIYYMKNDFTKGLEYSERSLKIDREMNYKKGQAVNLGNIGIGYTIENDLDKALEYFESSLEICKECNYFMGELNQIGNIGATYCKKGDLDNGLINFQKILELHRKIGAKQKIAQDLFNIGLVYRDKNDMIKSMEYVAEAFKTDEEYITRLTNS